MKMANKYGGKTFWHSQQLTFAYILIFQCIAVFLGNRSFIVGSTCSGLFVYSLTINHKKSIFFVIGILSIFVLTTILTLYVKSDSSEGRLLIYKISLKILNTHYFKGIGLENFQRYYNYYQADYFKSGNYTIKELLLADNTYFAFNDYGQLIIESGFVIIPFLALTFIGIYKIMQTSYCLGENQPAILIIAHSAFLSFIVAALFNHIFDRWWCQLISNTSLFVIVHYHITTAYPKKRKWIILFFLLSFTSIMLNNIYTSLNPAHNKWKEAENYSIVGNYSQAISLYDSLYTSLRNDYTFLLKYANELIYRERYADAAYILQRIIIQLPSNTAFLKLAMCQEKLGNNTIAEHSYLQAIYIVPNRFLPRLMLIDFYHKNHQITKERYWIQSSLALPLKVRSPETLQLVNEIKRRL